MSEARAILHLHPQGAYIGRALNYMKAFYGHCNVAPVFFPSFMDQYNSRFCTHILKSSPNLKTTHMGVTLDFTRLYDFSTCPLHRNTSDGFISETLAKDARQASIDTISRGLVWSSSEYFAGNSHDRDKILFSADAYFASLYYKSLKFFASDNVDVLIVSHMNYIYYVAPILAAHHLGIHVLLLHGGYNETIHFPPHCSLPVSPSHARNICFDQKLISNEPLLRFRSYSPNQANKAYTSLASARDLATTLKKLQSICCLSGSKRLAIVNHQVISEISNHFPRSSLTEYLETRYEQLKYLLTLLTVHGIDNILVRLHPSIDDYPGERTLVSSILSDFISNITVVDATEYDRQIAYLETHHAYPEIYTLGGNATLELLADGVNAYSIGESFLPQELKRYCLQTKDELEEIISKPETYYSIPPDKQQRQLLDKYIFYFRNTHLRDTKYLCDLQSLDAFYHFGNIRRPWISKEFISLSLESRLSDSFVGLTGSQGFTVFLTDE